VDIGIDSWHRVGVGVMAGVGDGTELNVKIGRWVWGTLEWLGHWEPEWKELGELVLEDGIDGGVGSGVRS
jgi:hypothetical protein